MQNAPYKRHILHMHWVEVPKGKVRHVIEEHSNRGGCGVGDDDYEPERPIKKSILIKRGYTNIHSNEETEKMSRHYNHDLLRLASPG